MHEKRKDRRECPNCRKWFAPSNGRQRWCSRKCRDAYQHRARRRLAKCKTEGEKEELRISFYEDRIEIRQFERRQYQKIFDKEIKIGNTVSSNGIIKIPISSESSCKFAVIDDTSRNREIAKMEFSLDHYGYPIIRDGSMRHLHHLVFGWPQKGYVVDHINRNPLDCRSCNLRFVKKGENNFNKKERSDNTSGKTGVYYSKELKKWYGRISKDGQTYNLGTYDSYEDAVAAREKAEIELYGYRLNGVMDNSHTRVLPASVNRGVHERSRLKGSKRSARRKKR